MACLGGCMLITAYLMDQFMGGSTLELAALALCLGVAGLSSLLLAWQQLVLAPRRECMKRTFRPMLRQPVEGREQYAGRRPRAKPWPSAWRWPPWTPGGKLPHLYATDSTGSR
jgi:hypothetical protein